MYKHILLPTDGSEQDAVAIASGVQLAKSHGAKVTGVYVIEESAVAAGIGKSMVREQDLTGAASEFLGVVSGQAARLGVPCECFTMTGSSAAESIANAARERGCDLIFMAAHGKRGIARLLLGSVTSQVLSQSTIPVLVFR